MAGANPPSKHEFRGIREHDFSLNPDKDPRGRFCPHPFFNVEIHQQGRVSVCCPAWNRRWIGNFHSSTLREIWESEAAREMRESILDGSFRHCDRKECVLIQSDALPKYEQLSADRKRIVDSFDLNPSELPMKIMLCYDRSCNLSCPSCRKDKINHVEGSPEYEKSMLLTEKLLSEIFTEKSDRRIILNVTGSGDPFASLVFRRLLEGIDGAIFPNLSIELQTNGVMMTDRIWGRIHRIHRNISQVRVSIDAARPETYAIVRRGGDWDLLLENLRLLHARQPRVPQTVANFVVQQRNFREMGEFARLFLDMGFNLINFAFINDWGTWSSREEYAHQCIWKTNHPEFDEFLDVLTDPILGDKRVFLGNVSEYRKAALTRTAAPKAQSEASAPV